MLSCLGHVKRGDDGIRPPAPVIFTDATFAGDRSGSMQSMGGAPKNGMKRFLDDQLKMAKTTGSQLHLTAVTFDDVAEEIFSKDSKKVTPYDVEDAVRGMSPRGCTR